MTRKKSVLWVLFLTVAALILPAFSASVRAEEQVPETNVNQLIIATARFIQYGDLSEEPIDSDAILLFINGSIVKQSNLILENDRVLLPVRLVSEYLGATVGWEPESRKAVITDGETTVELWIDQQTVQVNGAAITLDAAPRIIGGSTYVPARFVAEALQAEVLYYDGEDTSQTHIFPRIRQVMIARYPDDAQAYSKEEAAKAVAAQLLIAYERRYGEFMPAETEVVGDDAIRELWRAEGDAGLLRNVITFLKVTAENDRYYVLPVVFDFWFDKYTGAVYVFYNGDGMAVWRFDPYSDGALAFAG